MANAIERLPNFNDPSFYLNRQITGQDLRNQWQNALSGVSGMGGYSDMAPGTTLDWTQAGVPTTWVNEGGGDMKPRYDFGEGGLEGWLDRNQYAVGNANAPGQNWWWLQDQGGNPVIDPVNKYTNDKKGVLATMAALGAIGGASMLGAQGIGGTTAAQAAMMNPEAFGLAAQTGLGGGVAGGLAGAGGAAGGGVLSGLGAGMDWSTIVNLGANLLGSAIQSRGASNAADAQRAATEGAIAEQRRQYDTTRGDLAPWRTEGTWALGQLHEGLGQMPTSQEVMSDPGYQFGMDEGQKALARIQARVGGRASGAAMKAASRYATDYATSGYDKAYARRQDRLTRLAQLAQLGGASTTAGSSMGQGSANAISGLIAGQGDATAAQRLYQGGVWGNAANELGAMYGRKRNPESDIWRVGYGSPEGGGWTGDH